MLDASKLRLQCIDKLRYVFAFIVRWDNNYGFHE